MANTVLKWNNEVLKVGGAPMYWDVPPAGGYSAEYDEDVNEINPAIVLFDEKDFTKK